MLPLTRSGRYSSKVLDGQTSWPAVDNDKENSPTRTDARRPAALPCSCAAIGGALIALMSLNAQAEDGKPRRPSPDILLGPLFNDVQSAKLFADQKPSPTLSLTAIR